MFRFGDTQPAITQLADFKACIDAWAKVGVPLSCKYSGEGLVALAILNAQAESSLTVNVKTVIAQHSVRHICCRSTNNLPEMRNEYQLAVNGVDEKGREFIVTTVLAKTSENYSEWTVSKNSDFRWRASRL